MNERKDSNANSYSKDPFIRRLEAADAKLSPDPKREEEFNFSLPFSDLNWIWIYRDERIFKVEEAVSLWRLGRIKQLSYLTYIGPNPENQYLIPFDHDRLQHTTPVMKMSEIILRSNGASERDIELGITAAGLHDIATPALGDAAKKIDPVNLNEEDKWYEALDTKARRYLRERGLKRRELDEIIHNKGILGQVLDITDRISYVMLDLSQIINPQILEEIIQNANELDYRPDLARIVKKDKKVGSLYKDVRINWEDGGVYFVNPGRLGRFLEIRAYLNKYLYLHPVSQGRDMVVGKFISPYYSIDESQKDYLTPAKLRKMSDVDALNFLGDIRELRENIQSSLGGRGSPDHSFFRWYPEFWQQFGSLKELNKKMVKLKKNGQILIRGFTESKGFNPASRQI